MFYSKETNFILAAPQIGQKILIDNVGNDTHALGQNYCSAHVCNVEQQDGLMRVLTDLFGWSKWSSLTTVKVLP